MNPKRYPVALYLLLVALLSTPYYILLARSGSMDMGRGFVVHSLMWAPGVAGLLCAWIVHRSTAMLGLGWGRTRYVAAGYLLPIVYSLLAYLPLWLTGLAAMAFGEFARDSATRLHWPDGGALAPALLQIFLTLSFGAWPAVALHAVHNAFIQWLLDPMTDASGNGAWYAGEFGVALALSSTVVVLVLLGAPRLRNAPAAG